MAVGGDHVVSSSGGEEVSLEQRLENAERTIEGISNQPKTGMTLADLLASFSRKDVISILSAVGVLLFLLLGTIGWQVFVREQAIWCEDQLMPKNCPVDVGAIDLGGLAEKLRENPGNTLKAAAKNGVAALIANDLRSNPGTTIATAVASAAPSAEMVRDAFRKDPAAIEEIRGYAGRPAELPDHIIVLASQECGIIGDGWKDYKPAIGRFIVGVGEVKNYGPVYKEKNGGDTEILLEKGNIPELKLRVNSHEASVHSFTAGGEGANILYINSKKIESPPIGYNIHVGKSKNDPIRYIPPYAAVHICVKGD